MQWTWIVLGIVALLIVGSIALYNGLVARRQRVRDAWANIDTELRRRLDLIPNVVETVKGYATHEREVFERVTQARAAAADAASPAAAAAADAVLTAALRQLFAVAEAYPDLKANQNFLALQAELSGTEDRIASSRARYNAAVRDLNEAVQRFPAVLFASALGFREESYFEVEAAVRDAGAPKVDFSA
ncbi:MAG: LemA family protein [Actinomycetota bacterium]